MAKLALALGSDTAEGDRRIPIDRRSQRPVVSALGQTILLYRFSPGSFLMFVALGKVAGIEISSDGETLFCLLRDIVPFAAPYVNDAELVVPGAQRHLSLTAERFDAIVAAGRGMPENEELAEASAAVFEGPLRNNAPLLVYRQVLEGWGYRCAVTGEQFFAGEVPHPALKLAYLRPREQGGPLHVRNLMPMIAAAEQAWVGGTLSATDDYRIVAVMEAIGLELFDKIERIGRLHIPDDERYRPDPDHLAYHRAQVFGR